MNYRQASTGSKRKRFQKTWFLILMATVFVSAIDGIRIYEDVNVENPSRIKQEKSGPTSKKSSYITKRSWNQEFENFKSPLKLEKRSDGKTKELARGRGFQTDFPTLYKIAFKGNNFVQYVKYIREIPRMEEYTFCLWYRARDLSHDHNLFTYLMNKNEKLLRFWISGQDSVLRMAVRENVVYEIPANIRRNKWHHICQSWHGVAGQWKIFLDGKTTGAGVLSHYKETYIPGGGEIILGHNQVDKKKETDGNSDAEIFGFNLVDESVTGEQANFINAQYKPNLNARVPPFKKLPPMKKTYQEIRAYIRRLPSDSYGLGNVNPKSGEERNSIKGTRDSNSVSKRHRIRYSPLRRVVVYSREDRKLSPKLNPIEVDVKKTAESKESAEAIESGNATTNGQSYDENYSIHSYRMRSGERKSSNYEIYENLDEDPIENPKRKNETEIGRQQQEDKKSANFDLQTAREANKVYTLSAKSVRDKRKPKFHFEISPLPDETEMAKISETAAEAEESGKRKFNDSIPVREAEIDLSRRKRSPGSLAESFRRLPEIPDSFIDIFTRNASKTEMDEKLSRFFPGNSTEDRRQEVATEVPERRTTATEPEMPTTAAPRFDEDASTKPNKVLPPTLEPELPPPPKRIADRAEPTAERRNDPGVGAGAGAELVMRGYGSCATDRGSPIRNKERLVISWADTPIRIFGGAEIEMAKNECGNF